MKKLHHAATGEMEYSVEETEFIMAMDHYKRRKNCQFPTLCEVLSVLKQLGYQKNNIVEVSQLKNHYELKICNRCKIAKNKEQGFYKNKHSADGYQRACKKCLIQQTDENNKVTREALKTLISKTSSD